MRLLLGEFFALTDTPRRNVLLLALALAGIVSGAANAALLAIVGETLRHVFQWHPALAGGLFAGAALLFLGLQRIGQAHTAHLTEAACARIRLRLLGAAAQAALADSERVNPHVKRLVQRAMADMSIRLAVDSEQRLDVKPYSPGQKKRLASALALADDKPLCLFDEWTADQDPEFRSCFHTRCLPALKAAGKTLLVISHDEAWFHHADLIVRMEGGRLLSAVPPPAATGPGRSTPLLQPWT